MNQNQITIKQVSNTFLTLHAHLNELEQVFTQDIFIGIEPWVFPEDNYTVLAIWLLYDPVAHELFPVNKKKSWAELAERLSKYVGWVVDEHNLRRNYIRRSLKKAK